MRVAVLADCHIDHGVHRLDGYEAWQAATERIAEQEIDVAVVAGDMFHTGTADGRALYVAAEGLRRMADAGVETVLLAGNHELIGVRHPHRGTLQMEVLAHITGVQIVAIEPTVLSFDSGLHLGLLPWHAPTLNVPQVDGARMLGDAFADLDGPRMLVAHAMVSGSALLTPGGEVELRGLADKSTIPLAEVDHPDVFCRTVLGHVHGRQMLSDTCGYVGSTEQITFADEGQDKGFSVLTWDDDTQSWDDELVKVGVHNLVTVDLTEEHPHGEHDFEWKVTEGSLVRFRQHGTIGVSDIALSNAQEAGARVVSGAKVVKADETEPGEVRTVRRVTRQLTAAEMLERWADREQLTSLQRALLAEPAKRIIDVEVDGWAVADVQEQQDRANEERDAIDDALEQTIDQHAEEQLARELAELMDGAVGGDAT